MAAQDAGIRIEEALAVDAELVTAVAGLVGQLSSSAAPPTAAALEQLIGSPASHLLLARERDGRIVGMLTLVHFPIPTGVRAWIEDVVVDRDARRRGVGAALTHEALRLAAAAGARTVDLTSRPQREEANRLYEGLGFSRRETNIYRYEPPAAS
jgi:ribosomal protein S18 acetylase RimI-like enzyme